MKKFDKYFYYKESVQSPEEDVLFLNRTYKKLYGKEPVSLREDFCGTFSMGMAWLALSLKNQAFVVDHSKKPLDYGRTHYLSQLKPKEQKRIRIFNEDVLSSRLPGADIISVSNFSYFVFKEREVMLRYFKNARRVLKPHGLFIVDAFGGSEVYQNSEEKVEHQGFTYYWEQTRFNPINNSARFSIHFKRKREKKRKNIFIYDWRLWSLAEIMDILKEAGFSKTFVYWEGFDKKGEGTGIFRKRKQGDVCETWIAYIVSLP